LLKYYSLLPRPKEFVDKSILTYLILKNRNRHTPKSGAFP